MAEPPAQLTGRRADGRARLTEIATAAGLVGSILVVLGGCFPEYQPTLSPFADGRVLGVDYPFTWFRLAHLMVLAGTVTMLVAWAVLRREASVVRLRVTACLWSVPLVVSPPVQSRDAYSYVELGRMMAAGLNPYRTGLGAAPGSLVGPADAWFGTTSPYQPLSLEVFRWVVGAGADAPYAQALLMRVPALLAMVVVAACVPVVARRAGGDPAMATWLVVANPVLLVTLVGGAHNDALMLAFLCGALVAGQRRRWVVGGVLLGLACAVKLIALPVLLAMVALGLGDRWRRRELVTASAWVAVAALATFSVVSAATGLGVGWVQGLRDGTGIGTGPRQLINWLSGGRPPGAVVTLVLAGAAVVVVTVKILPRFPVQATAAYLGIVVMAQVNQRSWYWAVPILLVAIVPNPPWVWRLVGAWSAALSVELVLAEYNVPTLEPVSHVVIVAFVLGVAAGVGWWILSLLLDRGYRRASARPGVTVAVD